TQPQERGASNGRAALFTAHYGWRLSAFHLIEHRRSYGAGARPIRAGQLGVCLGHSPPRTYTDRKLLRLSTSPPVFHATLDSSSAHSTKLLAGFIHMAASSALE